MDIVVLCIAGLLILIAGYGIATAINSRFRERPQQQALRFALGGGTQKMGILRVLVELAGQTSTPSTLLLWTAGLLWATPRRVAAGQKQRLQSFLQTGQQNTEFHSQFNALLAALRERELSLWEDCLVGLAHTDEQLEVIILVLVYTGVYDTPPLRSGVARQDLQRTAQRLSRAIRSENGEVPRRRDLEEVVVVLCGMAEAM